MSAGTAVEKTVLVVGDAPEAERTAQELSYLGYAVDQVSPACVDILHLDGQVGSYVLTMQDDAGVHSQTKASAIVVATGNERYFPAEEYDVDLAPDILSLAQVRARLDEPRVTREALPHRNLTIALILDWGGTATSREMASEVMETAVRLRSEWHCEVYVLYKDLRVDSPGQEALTRAMREAGVLFGRYGAEAQIAHDEGQITFTYVEGHLRPDIVVLPEAIRPAPGTPELAQVLKVHLGDDGWLDDINIHQVRSGLSNRRGIVFAGRCYMDCALEDALADALQAAGTIDALLHDGVLYPDEIRAEVDSGKCIRCLTCVRTCPHAAVKVVEYPARNGDTPGVVAALVSELACQGCGACVGNCPVQAIELLGTTGGGETFPDWMIAPVGVTLQGGQQ